MPKRKVKVDGEEFEVELEKEDGVWNVTVQGKQFQIEIEGGGAADQSAKKRKRGGRGKKSGTISEEPKLYRRKSILDDVPDDFAARMLGFKPADRKDKNVDVETPEGFAVSIAYNKSGYQVIPKEDLKI